MNTQKIEHKQYTKAIHWKSQCSTVMLRMPTEDWEGVGLYLPGNSLSTLGQSSFLSVEQISQDSCEDKIEGGDPSHLWDPQS